MQQKEGNSIPRLSCQGLPTSETNGELALLQGSHGQSTIPVQIMPANNGLCYTPHDNESLEYDNNQEREADSDDSNVCQKMNLSVSDRERNKAMPFSKGLLTEKKEGLLLGDANLKQMAANSSDSEVQKLSHPAMPSQPATLAPSEEEICSSATDSSSSYTYDEVQSDEKSTHGSSAVTKVCVLLMVACLLTYGGMNQPHIKHHHDHKNHTTSQEFKEHTKEMKWSADKAAEGGMIHFCLPSEEPDIIDHQCPTTDPSIQQCVAEDFDDTFWSPFGKADESMCSVDGGMHYGPEAPFRDLTPEYDIPKYKERMDSSYFGSIHLLPMDKISLSVPSLKRKKRKKKSQCRSKQRPSRATVEISKPKPMPSHGTSTRYSVVLLFQLLVLLYYAVPVSVPLVQQEQPLLSDKANKPPSDQAGLANRPACADYQVIETWTFIDVLVIGLILLMYVHRQIIKHYVVRFWPDCRRWLVDGLKRIGCRSCCYLQKVLISACRRLTASARTLVITLVERAVKKMLRVCSRFTISRLVSVVKLLFRYIAGHLRRWVRVQPAECNEPQQPQCHNEPPPSDFQPQQPVSEFQEQSIHQHQAKQPPPATSSDCRANSLEQHQVTNSSPHNQNFANSAQKPLEEASQMEIADDFSASCSHVYPSTLDDSGVSPPYREHTDTVKLPSADDSASVQHTHSGTEKEGSRYSMASTSVGIHLEVKPCEPITCSDLSSNGELVCPTFIRSRDGNGFQNGEFVQPFQGAMVNDQNDNTTYENFSELTMIAPEDVTAAVSTDPPNKFLSFFTAVNYDLKTLPSMQTAKESLPERNPVNIVYTMRQESLSHDAMLCTLILSEADRAAIQPQDTPYLVCICQQ